MKNNINCSFNEDQELHSTLALIECGDACVERDEHDLVHTDFEPWSDCHNCISALYKQLLKISIDQRKEEAGIRKTQSKYFKNPVYIDRWRCNRGSDKSRCDYGQETDNPDSRSAVQSDNKSATGDNKEKVIPQSSRPSNKYPTRRSLGENNNGPICIKCFAKCNSGDVPPTIERTNKQCNSQFWNQAFGHRSMMRQQVIGSDAMKDITLSAFKNNVVWCSRYPDRNSNLDKGQPKASGPGSEENKVNKTIPSCKGKRKGSDGRRHAYTATSRQPHRPALSSPTAKRSQSQGSLLSHARLRSQSSMSNLEYTTLLPQSAPPWTLLKDPGRKMYSTKTIKKFLTYKKKNH